jgi:hypothetical protein
MIEEACLAIEEMSERDRLVRANKYARRNKMRYIDKLLNELEMLNLAETRAMPEGVKVAVDRLIADSHLPTAPEQKPPGSVVEAMDTLYEIQDGLMFNQLEEE